MRAILIILFITLPCLSAQAVSSVIESATYQKANELACKGDIEGFVQEGKRVVPDDKKYVRMRINLLNSPSELKAAIQRVNGAKKDIQNLSDLERLLSAAAIDKLEGMQDRSLSKKLLDFHSTDPIIEAYRKVYVAKSEFNTDPPQALHELTEVFYSLPYIDAALMHQIFMYATMYKNPLPGLRQFFPYIDQLSENSPNKYLLLADKNLVLSRVDNTEPDLSFAEKAYDLCSYDWGTVSVYAYLLFHKKMYAQAKEILLSLIDKHKEDTAYVDFLLAKIYLQENDLKKEKFYLDKAYEKKDVLPRSSQRELAGLMADNENRSKYPIWAGCAFLILLIIISLFWYFRKRITHRNQKHPLS